MVFPRHPDDDTEAYLELGHNLFHHLTYGFMDDGVVSPALFRLPGYPIFLELLGEHLRLIFAVQSALDLTGCFLLALTVARLYGRRAGLAALALGCLCFFTATYAAAALTESLSIFAVAAAIYACSRLLQNPAAFAPGGLLRRLLPAASTCMLAMMLRPDGALLTLSLSVALGVSALGRAGRTAAARTAVAFLLLAGLPLLPWTIRNAVTFHVFQPLAPRHVNDPGERVNLGFYRWLRTWSVDFASTSRVFWHVGTERIELYDLPPRAFDSPAQKAQTAELIAAYNRIHDVDQPLDERFAALAQSRIQHDPLRYFVWVPALRVADMWLRPRTEGMHLDVSWWRWREHPRESAIAIVLGLLNLAYLLLAFVGILQARRQPPPAAVLLLSYLVLRCLLLATLENPEPRYTLEAFPVLFVLASIPFAHQRLRPAVQAPS